MAHDRRHVDDHAAALPAHDRDRRAAAVDRTQEVHAHQAFVVRRRRLLDAAAHAEARVVDEHVEAAVALAGGLDEAPDLVFFRDVHDHRQAFRPLGTDAGRDFFEQLEAARTYGKARALACELEGRLAPDPGRGTGHRDDGPRQRRHWRLTCPPATVPAPGSRDPSRCRD
jgi:hypothetical protein